MLHVASVCTPCCILLDVVARCWAKFETCQSFNTVQTGALLLANQSQHCCANNVGSCWARIGSGLQTDATNPNMHFCWLKSLTDSKLCATTAITSNNMQQGVQTDPTCNIRQCCVRLYSALLQRTVSFKCLPIHVHLYA